MPCNLKKQGILFLSRSCYIYDTDFATVNILQMADPNFGARVKKTGARIMKITFITLLLIGIAVFSFFYWGTYEEGTMAGKILRISEKGMIFKTYEGKINLETFGALKGTSPIAESFDFSIEKNQTELIQKLQDVALSGERVNLHYVKRYTRFPWRGDTKYFATSVDRVEVKKE